MDRFYWDSFRTFFKIGAFTLGGGYAMIPLIESEVVEKHKWLSKEEFLDYVNFAEFKNNLKCGIINFYN